MTVGHLVATRWFGRVGKEADIARPSQIGRSWTETGALPPSIVDLFDHFVGGDREHRRSHLD